MGENGRSEQNSAPIKAVQCVSRKWRGYAVGGKSIPRAPTEKSKQER